jgi:hypothetical protein
LYPRHGYVPTQKVQAPGFPSPPEPLSPYRPESFDRFVKNKLPGKLFFSIIN